MSETEELLVEALWTVADALATSQLTRNDDRLWGAFCVAAAVLNSVHDDPRLAAIVDMIAAETAAATGSIQ